MGPVRDGTVRARGFPCLFPDLVGVFRDAFLALLERAGGDPRDDFLLQQQEQGQDRDHEHRRERHDAVPVGHLGADEAVDPDRSGLQLMRAQQRQRIDELAIGVREGDRADHHHGDAHQRQHDVAERLPWRAAVDAGGLLKLDGDLPEHRPQDHQRESERARAGREHDRRNRVDETDRLEDQEHRRRQQGFGKHLQQQDRDQGDVDQARAQPAHRIGADRAQADRNQRHRYRDHDAVAQVAQDVLPQHHIGEGIERRRAWKEGRRIREDLGLRLEARDHHPIDREQVDRDAGAGDERRAIPPHPAWNDRPAHSSFSR